MTNDNAPVATWSCDDCSFDGGAGALCKAADKTHTFPLLAAAYLSDGEDRHRAVDCVHGMVRTAPSQAVGFLIVATAACCTLAELCVVAAGPLEDLLDANGPAVIGHLEIIAKIDPRFRLMLSGTWGRDRIDPAVWERLIAAVAPGPVIDAEPRSPAAGMDDRVVTQRELDAIFQPAPSATATRH